MGFSKPLATCLAGAVLCSASASCAVAAPAIQALGEGVQIYACQASGTVFAWKLQGPDGVLSGSDGAVVGRHFAGPSWQAADGSTIVGEPLVVSPSPENGAIPWLVLHARSTAGPGLFSGVTYVTRTQTHGGAAPKTGCDAAHLGQTARVAYSATYTFFTNPGAGR